MRRVHFLLSILWTCAHIGGFVNVSSAADSSAPPSPSSSSTTWAHHREHVREQQCRDDLPAASVNDDYCDCVDGSDETETAACANGEYKCPNKGYISRRIYSSMVDDGVCDCCDGSDERKGYVSCANSCLELANQFCKDWENRISEYESGVKEREKVQKASTKLLASKQEELSRMEALVKEKKALQNVLNQELEDAEDCECFCECENDAKSDLANTRLPKPKSKRKEVKKEEKLEKQHEENSKEQTSSETEESEARKIAARWQGASAAGAAEEDPTEYDRESYDSDYYDAYNHDEQAFINDYEEYDVYGSEPFDYVGDDDYNSASEDNQDSGQGEEQRSEGGDSEIEKSADASAPSWQAIKERILEFLRKFSRATSGIYSKPRKTAREIKRALEAAGTDIATAQRKVANLKTYGDLEHNNNFGPNHILLSIEKDCYEYDSPEYTYRMCITGAFTQKEKSGGRNTVTLGKFSKWEDSHAKSGDNDPTEAYLFYSSGQACYQGPSRSVQVAVKCGLKPALLSIDEPARCEYSAILTAPFVCKDETLSILREEYRTSFCVDQHQAEL